MPHLARAFVILALSYGLTACTGAQGEYPSLAVRDVERATGDFASPEPARLDIPPIEVDLSGGLESRLAALVAAAENAHARFTEVGPRAERLVVSAQGSAIGSDNWAAAQVALAELDSARSQAAVPLGDLDAIHIAARVAAEDTSAIDAARDRVIMLVEEEDRTLEALRSRVR